jgi:response regulator of citrate/malate metabolism
MHLPDGHGLGLLRKLPRRRHLCDVIAVTSARDADVVRHAVAQGVVLYLLKPFTFATFRAKLEQYAAYRAQLAAAPEQVARTRSTGCSGRCDRLAADAAQGDEPETLRQVTARCAARTARSSATEVARRVGASRVTAGATWSTSRRPARSTAARYGGSGRPEVEYRWR